MRRDLPNLLSLRAFECAARHLSFTLAADELCVTQSAVSRHVKNLEAHYGKRLFNRLTREIELTEAGLTLFRTVENAFNAIEATSRELAPRDSKRSLVVSILPTLAATWLMPRLAKFTQSHQNVEVRLQTSIAPVSFERDGIDIAIRVGKPPSQRRRKGAPRIDLVMTAEWKGVGTDRLFADVLVPVCRPTLLGPRASVDAASLKRLPIIHTDSRAHAWADWFAAQGIDYRAGTRDLHFGHFFMSIRAALDGRGVAIVPDILVENYIASGELVIASPARVTSAGEYHLMYRKERAGEAPIAAFREWVCSESASIAASQGLPH